MELLYTMNAPKSEPNDFKLITPSKYIVQKVVGSSSYELSCQLESPQFLSQTLVCCCCCCCCCCWQEVRLSCLEKKKILTCLAVIWNLLIQFLVICDCCDLIWSQLGGMPLGGAHCEMSETLNICNIVLHFRYYC